MRNDWADDDKECESGNGKKEDQPVGLPIDLRYCAGIAFTQA
jgi:hypothetical protein